LSDNHESRISALEHGVVEIRSDLRALGGVLGEIKAAIDKSRPSLWVVIPIALTFIIMIVGGVAAFGGLREDGAGREARLNELRRDLDRMEQRQWEMRR
jgi:hypothetical protein